MKQQTKNLKETLFNRIGGSDSAEMIAFLVENLADVIATDQTEWEDINLVIAKIHDNLQDHLRPLFAKCDD